MRTLYRLAARARRLYWFVFRPRTTGVKCVVAHDGRWLMIRNTYGRGHWTFPGGAVDRGEAPERAAAREVLEEVGIQVADLRPIGSYYTDHEYKRDTVYCFVAATDKAHFSIDPTEIAEAAWYEPTALPDFRGPSVDRIVGLLQSFDAR